MAKRIGKYKISKRESTFSLVDGGKVDGIVESRFLSSYQFVDNTTAFVRNADSIVTWTQPADTVITAIHLFFPSSTYST